MLTRAERLAKKRLYNLRPEVVAREKIAFRKRYLANPDKYRTYTRHWIYRNKYGIEPEDVNKMEKAQRGRCKICRKKPKGKGLANRLHVDHCHKTGKVRGMLCIRCNRAIGCFLDSPTIILSAFNYLKEVQ